MENYEAQGLNYYFDIQNNRDTGKSYFVKPIRILLCLATFLRSYSVLQLLLRILRMETVEISFCTTPGFIARGGGEGSIGVGGNRWFDHDVRKLK